MKVVSIIFLLIGIIMFFFSSSIGTDFAERGNKIFKDSPFFNFGEMYHNENKIKIGIKVLGIVFMLQSILMFVLAFLLNM